MNNKTFVLGVLNKVIDWLLAAERLHLHLSEKQVFSACIGPLPVLRLLFLRLGRSDRHENICA